MISPLIDTDNFSSTEYLLDFLKGYQCYEEWSITLIRGNYEIVNEEISMLLRVSRNL